MIDYAVIKQVKSQYKLFINGLYYGSYDTREEAREAHENLIKTIKIYKLS
jgi:hypothetical protein